ncbi:MAG: S24/S26 family peptidase [Candidatus Aenigmarchaeota archaeon]|nr:S24/S26 family peptidase [Candidatus Aenigmarchaeota archaeon]
MPLLMRFKVRDRSMEPALREGDYVLVSSVPFMVRRPAAGDIVVARHKGMFVIKRIRETEGDVYTLLGDNPHGSGFRVPKKAIVGKVVLHVRKK